MKLLWQVDEAEAIIEEKDGLNQLETKAKDLEEDKHRSEASVAKQYKMWIS